MFFFLQAEDGIRDADVTGVQTCALPIYMTSSDQMYRGSIPNSEVNVTYRLRTIAFPTRNVSGRSTSYPIVNSSSPNAWAIARLIDPKTAALTSACSTLSMPSPRRSLVTPTRLARAARTCSRVSGGSEVTSTTRSSGVPVMCRKMRTVWGRFSVPTGVSTWMSVSPLASTNGVVPRNSEKVAEPSVKVNVELKALNVPRVDWTSPARRGCRHVPIARIVPSTCRRNCPKFTHNSSPAATSRSSDGDVAAPRSEEHTSELQSRPHIVCRLLLEKKKNPTYFVSWCTRSISSGTGPPSSDVL